MLISLQAVQDLPDGNSRPSSELGAGAGLCELWSTEHLLAPESSSVLAKSADSRVHPRFTASVGGPLNLHFDQTVQRLSGGPRRAQRRLRASVQGAWLASLAPRRAAWASEEVLRLRPQQQGL